MSLNMAGIGEKLQIKKIRGKDETKRFLAGLGFIEGQAVTVISSIGGNLICNVKDTRVAIDRGMANRIFV